MDFKKLYVDNLFLKSLQKIAVHEKWLSDPEDNLLRRNYLRSRTLLYLTLFEEIDSPSLLFYETDCSRLIDAGLLRQDARLLDDSRSRFEEELGLGQLSEYHNAIKGIKKTAHQMLADNSWKIIDQHYVKVAEEGDDTVLISDVLEAYDYALVTPDDKVEIEKPDLIDLKDSLERTRYTLEELLFISMYEQAPFASDFTHSWHSISHADLKLVETAMYVVRTRLREELVYLPDPRNLSDVVRMRSDPSLNRLRSVLQEWATYLQLGEQVLEAKARKDIRKANKEIRTLARWRQYKKSPLNFWMNSIGGHIPILSNILTAVFMIGGLFESHVERKSNWVMLGKS